MPNESRPAAVVVSICAPCPVSTLRLYRFRRYAPRMLRALDIQAAAVALPLKQAAQIIADDGNSKSQSTSFLRRGSKWHRHLNAQAADDYRLWEVAVLSHLREAFRSGDIWLAHSRRYADLKQALVPIEAARATPRLTVPFDPESWLADRKVRLTDGCAFRDHPITGSDNIRSVIPI